MQNLFDKKLNNDIKFLNTHIGGDVNDTTKTFEEQLEIINDNNIDKDFNKNFNNTDIKVNNSSISYGEFNCNNPIIYPEIPDLYFQYIQKKNLKSLNSQVITQIDYINIDSSSRNLNDVYNISNYYRLLNNPLCFTNNSSIMYIRVSPEIIKDFSIDNLITLDGFQYYNEFFEDVNFIFEPYSSIVTLNLKANFEDTIPFVNIYIKLSNLSYFSNNITEFKNINANLFNSLYPINVNSDGYITFEIPATFYSQNDSDNIFISKVQIEFYNIGNFPINQINANYPYTPYNIISYHRIKDIDLNNNYLIIDIGNIISINQNLNIKGTWLNNIFYTGGNNIQLGLINDIEYGNDNSSILSVNLNKIYKNIISIEMISSAFPNTIYNIYNVNITNTNNRFYWENIFDKQDQRYVVELPIGKYTYEILVSTLEKLIKNTLLYKTIENQDKYNLIKINLNLNTNTTTFKSYKLFNLPKCLINLYPLNNELASYQVGTMSYQIDILHPNHQLQVGQTITIVDSINYQNISSSLINGEHKIINVFSKDVYTIQLDNVNLILEQESIPTNGGYKIKIYTDNSFRLLFNQSDTFGTIFGFRNVGSKIAVTNFTTYTNDFTLTNLQPYFYENQDININKQNFINLSDQKYFLLKCDNLNKCSFPGGTDYFYKISFAPNNQNDKVFYNNHDNLIHYFYPPYKKLTNLNFQVVDVNNNLVNFNNLNYTFTLKIISVFNYPENTNINPNIARV
jgi:hypothetical protein